MRGEIREIIRRFILDNFVYQEGGDPGLRDDASLLDEGVLDSVGVLSVIGFLEEMFQIEVEDHEVVPDNLESVDAMAAFVQRKRNPQIFADMRR
jgi:acyl carrier protein